MRKLDKKHNWVAMAVYEIERRLNKNTGARVLRERGWRGGALRSKVTTMESRR